MVNTDLGIIITFVLFLDWPYLGWVDKYEKQFPR